MDRRTFLKQLAGISIGFAATNLLLPTAAKCKIISPVSDLIANNFLDQRIKTEIKKIKYNNPKVRLGETHCHSIFSDGNFSIQQIMERSAFLGLDFLVVTEHIIPKK